MIVTLEHLLRQQNLTLDTVVIICQAQEAAKNQHREILNYTPGAVLTIKQPPHSQKQSIGAATTQTCPNCGAKAHQGGHFQCPAFSQPRHHSQKIGHYAIVRRARQSW